MNFLTTRIYRDVLREVGLKEHEVLLVQPGHPYTGAGSVLVALGDTAAKSVIPGWTGSVLEKRGYTFDSHDGRKVVVSAGLEDVQNGWVPWRVLLRYDFERAIREAHHLSTRPERTVTIVSSDREASEWAERLIRSGRCAADIENYDAERIACIGFAADRRHAIVYPVRYIEHARRILENDAVRTVWCNGQYDLYYLLTRCGIRVAGKLDDVMLAWHACYPELAGKAQNKKSKRTRKSLSFLASVFTDDAWWKEYDFTTEDERYVLNGRDCCTTLEIMEKLDKEIDRLDVRKIYEHGLRLVWPVVTMQQTGLRVDDDLRQARLLEIEERISGAQEKLQELVLPLVRANLEKIDDRHLFETRTVCKCCKNGKAKRLECWSCAGLTAKPGKKVQLTACVACAGAGEFFTLSYNPNSVPQNRVVLYDLLKLPKRFSEGKLSTDEETLKALLA